MSTKPDEDEITTMLQAYADMHGEKAAEYVVDGQKRLKLAELARARQDRYLKAIAVLKEQGV